jgi:16S rRNA processing protein RimM
VSIESPTEEVKAADDLVVLGKISGIYGVNGWVRVYSYTSPRDNILAYPQWLLKRRGGWEMHKLCSGKKHGKGIVVKIEGCDDRDQAAAMMDLEIAVYQDQLPKAEAGEYYWRDLEGLQVETVDGIVLGKIAELFVTGANDVIVIKGDRERLVPFVTDDVVKSVDLEANLMVVDWDPDF